MCVVSIVGSVSFAAAMDLQQLLDEYDKNPSGFSHKYAGSTLTFDASIFSFALDAGRSTPTSGPEIGVIGDNFAHVAHCYLNDADKRRAFSVAKGDKVRVTGTFVMAGLSGLHFAPCTFTTIGGS